ncbi:murein hydrolase activator EnvC family protein [Yinghuangia seranimata]|uniref:murein hydrolase activator EnvC family protein n=1 Tax=Yinghuangia seranimata TaxID=408067 RepID=UPI00248B0156|nr:peptidoglycan DD-metalloendopeptidase family protein [Yinghuangia seranimata]MDI2131413.1 peptidoglycan DD-metalloendopeptidase family protein [Yinghuangia seranimata]
MRATHRRRVGLLALIAATGAAIGWGTAHADDDPRTEKTKVEGQVRDVRADLDGAVRRLADAENAYADADARLPGAQAALATARDRLAAAQTKDADLRRRLDIAVGDEAAAQQQVRDLDGALAQARDALGTVARHAYEHGDLAALSVVMQAETPAQLLSRLEGYHSLMRADDAVLSRLRQIRQEADGRQKALAAARDQVRADREAAAAQLTEVQALETAARTASDEVERLVAQRRGALETARQEKSADQQRYESLLAEQRRLTELVNRLNAPSPGRRPGAEARGQDGALSYPLDGPVTSPFGMRFHPVLEYVKLHTGTDFGAVEGTPVHAAREGTVISAGYNPAYGYRVVVSHGQVGGVALTTTYNHLSRIDVGEGRRVKRGGTVGLVGNTGYSTGAHLHFEVLVDGEFADPLTWL